MKMRNILCLASTLAFLAGCTTGGNAGVALTVDNAATYLDLARLNEQTISGQIDGNTVTFSIYPNSEGGKLFYEDIKGKCSITAKYSTGSTGFVIFGDEVQSSSSFWSDPVNVDNISFSFQAGGASESGFKQVDYLKATYTFDNTDGYIQSAVYNVKITEITGHMHA